MTLQTFTPPIAPSSTKKRPKLRLLKAEFGDGYTQTTRDGMNHQRNVIDLTWEVLTPAQADAITAFFEEHGGDTPFLYNGTKFTCEVWEDSTGRGGFRTITATFEQSFNITA